MKKIVLLLIFLSISFIVFSCKEGKKDTVVEANPLPSFNEVPSKNAIINYVKTITDSTSADYVKPEDRIVCFDNDGTLWAEQPLPSQIFFVFDKIKELAKTNAKYKIESPYKEVINDDLKGLLKVDKQKLIAMIGEIDSLNNENYNDVVNHWLDSAKHPKLGITYNKTVYQPMLELLDYLRANDFTIYIVSGGGTKFMRAWQPKIYGIEENNIIGSTFKTEVIQKGDSIAVLPTSKFDFYDDHMGKVINIQKIIGKKPIMIIGNSDGDLEMMEYASTNNPHKSLMLYVKHTDGEREFDYSKGVIAGALKNGEVVANKKGWTIIDMKKDWKTVFPDKK